MIDVGKASYWAILEPHTKMFFSGFCNEPIDEVAPNAFKTDPWRD